MTTTFAKILSVVAHPLFVVSYLLIIILAINPYLFSIQDVNSLQLVVISVIALSVGFPLLTIVMLRLLNLVSSFEMENRMERIGPLIASGLFYLWLFINIHNNPIIPKAFSIVVLGSTIGLFMAFFMNNFYKISLHAVGMGGFVVAILFFRFSYSYDFFTIANYKVNTNLIVILAILIAGIVGSSRLILKKHSNFELYSGYLVGILSQLIAFRILL